jgi:hypothetical protein
MSGTDATRGVFEATRGVPEATAGLGEALLASGDGSLLDLVDHLLNQGVVLQAEVILGLAGIDLVYLRLTALLCATDRLTPSAATKRSNAP